MCTAAGLVWIAPSQALLVVLAVLGMPVLLLAMQPLLTEWDLRVRTQAGALGRVSLDALLGLTAVRTHSAERAMQREYASLLVEWTRAGRHLQRAVVSIDGIQGLVGFGFTAGPLITYLAHGGEANGVLLLTYWALRLSALGQELMLLARQYPGQRNTTLRLLEPLGAREEGDPEATAGAWEPTAAAARAAGQGVAIALEGVSVVAGGHTILTDLNLALVSGSHVAIVGPSGADKSSLVGLLLGWHRPSRGRVLVDGHPLDDAHLAWVRQITAWVDPAIQLWNRPLLDNLCYGVANDPTSRMAQALAQADLQGVLTACWWWKGGGLSKTTPRPAWPRVQRRATAPC
jgi:ATP-binding cassette subfamily B protein